MSSSGNSADVEFILKVKNASGPRRQSDDARSVSTVDTMCTAATDTTDTTLQFQDSYEDLMDMVRASKLTVWCQNGALSNDALVTRYKQRYTMIHFDYRTQCFRQVSGLKKQLELSEQRAANLEKEKVELLQRKTAPSADDKKNLDKTASEMLQLRTRLHEIQSTNEELKVYRLSSDWPVVSY